MGITQGHQTVGSTHLVCYRAVNVENDSPNKVRNLLTGDWGAVPDTARSYKVGQVM